MPVTIAVIIASYQRAGDLGRCLKAVAPQLASGDELIVVTRPIDKESREMLNALDIPLTSVDVHMPGVIHAENAGLAASSSDLVAFIDDDGIAPPDWLKRIRAHFFRAADLGALCGPVLPVIDGEVQRLPTGVWGRVLWYGRHIGNTDRIPDRLIECDIVRGCNMAFRRKLLVRFDTRLLGYWRFEDDAALTVKAQNYRVICDPELAVLHYLAPVRVEFSRVVSPRDAYCLNHNNTYVLGKHFPVLRRIAFLIYTFAIGDHQSLGVARLLSRLVQRRDWESVEFALASLAGKLAGLRSLCTQA
jgi:glycosyltransferase involved in cell wall biosynthesis